MNGLIQQRNFIYSYYIGDTRIFEQFEAAAQDLAGVFSQSVTLGLEQHERLIIGTYDVLLASKLTRQLEAKYKENMEEYQCMMNNTSSELFTNNYETYMSFTTTEPPMFKRIYQLDGSERWWKTVDLLGITIRYDNFSYLEPENIIYLAEWEEKYESEEDYFTAYVENAEEEQEILDAIAEAQAIAIANGEIPAPEIVEDTEQEEELTPEEEAERVLKLIRKYSDLRARDFGIQTIHMGDS